MHINMNKNMLPFHENLSYSYIYGIFDNHIFYTAVVDLAALYRICEIFFTMK